MKRWILSKPWFWEEAPFFRLLLPLALAIICYDRSLVSSVAHREYETLGLAALLLVAGSLVSYGAGLYNGLKAVCIQVPIFLLGLVLCNTHDIRNDRLWFGRSVKNTEAYAATVLENPTEKEKTWKIKVAITDRIEKGEIKRAGGEAFVYLYKDGMPPNILQGDVILLPNKWQPIRNPGNPHEFDYAKFCNRNNLYYTQFLAGKEITVLKRESNGASFIANIHHQSMMVLEQYIKDTSALGLMQAMLLGDEVNFEEELRKTYTDTGIIHIVAISGSHVAIFFLLTTGLLFWIDRKRQYVKYLVAIPFIWLYVMVAGSPTSAVRAGIMFSLVGLGFAIRRDHNSLNTLFATAFIMLAANPMWLYSIGFQLSFVAVLSLMLFYRPVSRLLYVPNFLLRKLWQTAAASIAAEILIAPIVIYYFHLLPITFLIANVLAYLFMGAVLVLGMLLILLGKLAVLAKPLGILITFLVLHFNALVEELQHLNPISFAHLRLSLVELSIIYIIVAGLAIFLLQRTSKALIVGLAGSFVLLLLLISDKVGTLQQEKLIVYNISGANYAEIIKGQEYHSLMSDSSMDLRKWHYATDGLHTASGGWRAGEPFNSGVLVHKDKTILVLNNPVQSPYASMPSFDYVLINYQIKEFEPDRLKQLARERVIIGNNQKRYMAERWRDSCLKYDIPAHFTQLDGAFIAP